METSAMICRANQSTGFYVIGTSVMKELNFGLRRLMIDKLVCGFREIVKAKDLGRL